jgi:ubiquinone biosynthesis monooxygenase Coq7
MMVPSDAEYTGKRAVIGRLLAKFFNSPIAHFLRPFSCLWAFYIMLPMNSRELNPLDRLLSGIDAGLRTLVAPTVRHTRPNPAEEIPDADLSAAEKAHAAGLMRVNHAGEVAAQGLYQGHASVARDKSTEKQMLEAADEELDHLGWCEQRLDELGESPSKLRPVWYTGAFAIGAASGILGDRWSLGFIEETERQVAEHLTGHLQMLPETDARSRAIVKQMCEEEEVHGANAKLAGAASLPLAIRGLMRLTAKVMTSAAYRF